MFDFHAFEITLILTCIEVHYQTELPGRRSAERGVLFLNLKTCLIAATIYLSLSCSDLHCVFKNDMCFMGGLLCLYLFNTVPTFSFHCRRL
jgi:hypothetical protein